MLARYRFTWVLALAGWLLPQAAQAQDAAGDAPATQQQDAATVAPEEEEMEQVLPGDEQAVMEERFGVERTREPTDPFEDPDETYLFVGAFYEHTFTPTFILNLFLDESPGADNSGFGFEFSTRKDGMSLVARAYYQGGRAEGPFRASGDPVGDTEWIDSNLWALMGSVSFLWAVAQPSDVFAFEMGLGVGVGAVFGDLVRTEAYQDSGDRWAACQGVGNPSGSYCEPGGQYNHRQAKWFDGGNVPNLWFRLSLPHIAFRFKPIRQLVARVEAGFQVPLGPWVGLSVLYGI